MPRPARRARPRARKAAPAAPRGAAPPIVGIGASAGGLAALSSLLRGLPPKPGAALVLVQHLLPDRASALPQLLSSIGGMPAVQARHRMPIEADRIYVVPPNAQMTVADGKLRLAPRPGGRSGHASIDVFFRSLAQALGDRAIAVLLSGNSSDGVAGLREVKTAGGTTIVQSPDTAEFDVMPRAAVDAGVADVTLAPADIGAAIIRLLAHGKAGRARGVARKAPALPDDQMSRVFALLRNATGVASPTTRSRPSGGACCAG